VRTIIHIKNIFFVNVNFLHNNNKIALKLGTVNMIKRRSRYRSYYWFDSKSKAFSYNERTYNLARTGIINTICIFSKWKQLEKNNLNFSHIFLFYLTFKKIEKINIDYEY